MSQETLQQAKSLIQAKRYEDARRLLQPLATSGSTTAKMWLARLNTMEQPADDIEAPDIEVGRTPKARGNRWNVLRVLAFIYTIFGGLVFLGSVVLAYSAMQSYVTFSGTRLVAQPGTALLYLVAGIVGAFSLAGVGQVFMLLIAIEANTRRD